MKSGNQPSPKCEVHSRRADSVLDEEAVGPHSPLPLFEPLPSFFSCERDLFLLVEQVRCLKILIKVGLCHHKPVSALGIRTEASEETEDRSQPLRTIPRISLQLS